MTWGRPLLGAANRPKQALFTTVTSSSAAIYTTTYTFSVTTPTTNTQVYTAYGFDVGSDYWAYGPGFGSISTGSYTDNRATSRTIDSCYWIFGGTLPYQPSPWLDEPWLYFVLDGTSITNDDRTFYSIKIDGAEFLRSDATYTASVDGGTAWRWPESSGGPSSNPFAGANPDDFEVWVAK